MNNVLNHFNQEEFFYTLQPPPLGSNPIDRFLFDSKRGFCEHYASAFTFMMRSAGIPARVVVGFQGGEPNPIGGHMVVRMSDAHAWSEVWIEGEGWRRVDPTAAVAPGANRIFGRRPRVSTAWRHRGGSPVAIPLLDQHRDDLGCDQCQVERLDSRLRTGQAEQFHGIPGYGRPGHWRKLLMTHDSASVIALVMAISGMHDVALQAARRATLPFACTLHSSAKPASNPKPVKRQTTSRFAPQPKVRCPQAT